MGESTGESKIPPVKLLFCLMVVEKWKLCLVLSKLPDNTGFLNKNG